MAEMSGKSHYIKFYPGDRVARLYIPYPYSKQLSTEMISKVFKVASGKTTGSAYIRDTFGLLDKAVVAHLDDFRRVVDGLIQVIKKGIVKDHIIKYNYVED